MAFPGAGGDRVADAAPVVAVDPQVDGKSEAMSRLLLVLLIACGGGAASTPAPATPAPRADDPACPVAIPGTSVTVEDTDTGAALVFVTTGDVADLRKRAGVLAQQHNDHHAAMGPLPDGTDANSGPHHHDHAAAGGTHDHAAGGGAGSMIGVHSKAVVAEIEGGAKVAFVAATADVGTLQGELRMHAKHYAAGSCEMK